jgi:hypothetical protein
MRDAIVRPTEATVVYIVTANLLRIALAVFGIVTALGVVLFQPVLTYFADEWVWLRSYLESGKGIFCRLEGHPTLLLNAQLWADYNFFGGSPLMRAMVTAGTGFVAMLLIGCLAAANQSNRRTARASTIIVIGSAGLSGVRTVKLFWLLGTTDTYVLIGSALAAFGLAQLSSSRNRSVAYCVVPGPPKCGMQP